jgi:FkbM family methyltransferase
VGLIRQISEHVHRMRRARRFGVSFVRRSRFTAPVEIHLNGRPVPLSFPPEPGVTNDFLACIIEDHYGLQRLLSRPRTILDIGANVGFFALAARHYFPDALIHAYEPNPRIKPMASANADVGSFVLYAEAVGAERGFVSISDDGDSNQARTDARGTVEANIPQTALRDAVARLGGLVDLAKIDCEGAEWELLEDRDSWSRIRQVRMEYHLWGVHTFSELEHALKAVHFSIEKHVPCGEFGLVWCDNRSI